MPHRIFKPVKISLVLIALSWVLSNIGTSNLYVWSEAFGWNYAPGQNVITAALAIGIYGFFLLYVKYVLIGVLHIADDNHSGGVYIYNQIRRAKKLLTPTTMKVASVAVCITAIALWDDGLLTGPVSVSSALETSRDVTGTHFAWVKDVLSDRKILGIPQITFVGMSLLSILFFLHRFGPSRFNVLFGPVAVLYFGSSLVTGVILCFHTGGLAILYEALNPMLLGDHIQVVWEHPYRFGILGGLFLFFSGFEAAFTDTGLVGKRSMFWAVNIFFVCVLFQYVGQANMLKYELLHDGAGTPFAQGLLVLPGWLGITHSTLAIVATIMASFSLMVAIQHLYYELAEIGWFARLKKRYFKDGEFISYFLNSAQWAGCMILYLIFQKSSNMLNMYGISICAVLISSGMLIGIHRLIFARGIMKYVSVTIVCIALVVEVIFFWAALHKIWDGGFVSIIIMLLMLPVILSWIYFEKYKKDHQFIVAKHAKMGNLIARELVPLLCPNDIRSINAVYCKKDGNLTSTDFCAIRGLLLERRVKKLYLFSVRGGNTYDYTIRPICENVYEIIRTYPYKSPQYNDDVLNKEIGIYSEPSVPSDKGESGQSDWQPFRADRNLETINGSETGLLFGIGKWIYQYLKTKEVKTQFNQTVIPIEVPVNTTIHYHAMTTTQRVGEPARHSVEAWVKLLQKRVAHAPPFFFFSFLYYSKDTNFYSAAKVVSRKWRW